MYVYNTYTGVHVHCGIVIHCVGCCPSASHLEIHHFEWELCV